jgi:hypothetical protein
MVWFLLFDSATGQLVEGTTADKVSVASPADVADFRKAVKAECFNKLSSVDAADLLVYQNKDAFEKRNAAVDDGKEAPLEEDYLIDGLGTSKKEALVVVVPSSRSSSRRTSESSLAGQEPDPRRKQRWIELNEILEGNAKKPSSLAGQEPDPKRKQRWIELNEILEGNAKKPQTNDSIAYSYITWNQVRTVFNPTKYVQPRRNIDDAQLSFLAQYLSITTKCFRDIKTGKDAKRLHFIAPILICVCILLDGDVEILVEEDLVGNFVKAHGHFEFMLRHKNKAVCIIEAKKDDIEQGMIQDLVGCEVVAELGRLDIVYGIVTNYIQWNFMRILDDKVEIEECSLSLTPNGPERGSLKKIAEKIFGMLSS